MLNQNYVQKSQQTSEDFEITKFAIQIRFRRAQGASALYRFVRKFKNICVLATFISNKHSYTHVYKGSAARSKGLLGQSRPNWPSRPAETPKGDRKPGSRGPRRAPAAAEEPKRKKKKAARSSSLFLAAAAASLGPRGRLTKEKSLFCRLVCSANPARNRLPAALRRLGAKNQ